MKKYEQNIKIEGKTWDEIAFNYLGYFREGWTVTIDELAEYLRCNYTYITKNVARELPHIYINRAANKALYRYFKDEQGASAYDNFFPLITKKYLFHPDEVEKYFLQHMILVKEELVKDEKTKKEIKIVTKSIPDEFPKHLLSAKDLIDGGIFDYDIQLRRFTLNHGISKVLYKNLVRYRQEDFKILPLIVAENQEKPDE
jgi:hypothetical protein